MQEGKKLRMKNIGAEQIASMNLEWMWEAGMPLTFVHHLNGSPYKGMTGNPASLVETRTKRRIWVYNEYLTGFCIWE